MRADCRVVLVLLGQGELFPEVPLGQDGRVQGVHGLSVVAQAPHGRDVPKLPLLQEALGLMQGVLLLGQEQLLPHVVLELVLGALLRHLHLQRGTCQSDTCSPTAPLMGPSYHGITGVLMQERDLLLGTQPGLPPGHSSGHHSGSVLTWLIPTLAALRLQLPDPSVPAAAPQILHGCPQHF